jgi:4-amino-4-deoxy-L-arabinose transferase-like glycosyltransferase
VLGVGAAMLIVFSVALVMRVGAAAFVPDGKECKGCSAGLPIKEHLGGDGLHYLLAGRALADGKGFVTGMKSLSGADTPYAGQPPLWTLIVGGTDLVGLESVFSKQLLFSVLGAATAVLVGFAGREIASERVGIIAGAVAALYPGFWIYERNLNSETIAFPLIAVVLILTYRYRDRPGWGLALALGTSIGLLILVRSESGLFIPLVLVPLILSTRDVSWASRIARLTAAGAIIVLLLTPWVVYNAGRFEKPVLLSTGFGYTAKAGACDATFYGDRLGSFDQLHCLFFAPGAAITEASVQDAELRKDAFEYTRDHIGRLPIVLAARQGRTWSLFPPGLEHSINGQLLNAPTAVLWLQWLFYLAILIPAVCGAVLLRRRRVLLYPLLAFPIAVVVATSITFGEVRYRAPAEITLVILAAVTIDAALRRWWPATRSATRAPVHA